VTPRDGTKVTKKALCKKNDRDLKYWAADLKTDRLGILTHVLPDNQHDWHDGTAAAADAFFAARIHEYLASEAYAEGGALVITADEDNKKGANDVPFYVFHRSLDGKHRDAGDGLALIQLSAFLGEVAGVEPLGGGKDHKGEFATAFGITA
jgi:hypothetical protein